MARRDLSHGKVSPSICILLYPVSLGQNHQQYKMADLIFIG